MSFLFTIIVTPIVQILELFYSVFYRITHNCGFSVVSLSFVITLCTLPLYMVAEKWQETERQVRENMKPFVARIKDVFKGDEQYMILSTLYRQNHYHPMMALRSSFSLLIQIPFFIAAYSFLSHLESLKGVSFLFIKDFGNPDAVFHIGSFSVNILPIAMTAINCVSGAIYSKGHPVREKIQIYGMAAIFLVLLYNSPSALVVYWTMNNILSLAKNIFYKIKNPKKVLYVIACVVALCFIIFPFWPYKMRHRIIGKSILGIGIAIPFVPFVVKFLANLIDKNFLILDKNKKLRDCIFFFSVALLSLLAGLCIPLMIVVSEPVNYCFVEDVRSPFVFIRHTMFVAIGLFAFWPACFYKLFSEKVKKAFALIFSLCSFAAIINTFAFSGEYGALLPECVFMFEATIDVSKKDVFLHFVLIVIVFVLLIFLLVKFPKIVRAFLGATIFSMCVLIAKNSITISREYKIMEAPVVQEQIVPAYHLSKTDKNVIVIMQDRLFSPYVNLVLNDFPELKNAFDGFVFYPNTISNGWLTMLGVPEVFGGYDFTPFEINKRTDETLQKKHNEALLTMPVLFHEANFNVAVANLPYENFFEYPIDNMYKGYEFVDRVNTKGLYTDLWFKMNNVEKPKIMVKSIKRNMIWFSIFKICPPFLRDIIYYNEYWNSELDSEKHEFIRFVDNYAELDLLPKLIDFSSDKDSFVMIDNEMTHEPTVLQYPDFVPVQKVTQFAPSKYGHDKSYCTTVAAMKKFKDLILHLKENDVYDNTRIIIVSDHGAAVDVSELKNNPDFYKGKSTFVATLLVKDFGCVGDIKSDMTFMLNADTPYLATKDIVPDAKNPFTGNPLKVENKNDFVRLADGRPEGTRSRYKTKFNIKDNEWGVVKDNIFVDENWAKVNFKDLE